MFYATKYCRVFEVFSHPCPGITSPAILKAEKALKTRLQARSLFIILSYLGDDLFKWISIVFLYMM